MYNLITRRANNNSIWKHEIQTEYFWIIFPDGIILLYTMKAGILLVFYDKRVTFTALPIFVFYDTPFYSL